MTDSLTGAWVARWAAAPDARVVHDGGRWTTAAEIAERTAAVAGRLAAAGLVAGDRVLMSAPASVDLVVAHVAALRLGLVVVPVHTAYGARELGHVVRDAQPRAAVVATRDQQRWVVEAAAPQVPLVVGPDVALPDASPPPLDAAAGNDLALLVYTSGTTGAPKGAALTHANLLAGAHAVVDAWRWSGDDRLVLALPLFHMHGLGVGLHGTLTAGASLVLRPSFVVDDVLDAAAAHDASLFFGVPTMYTRLVRSPRAGELRRVRLCVSGSAPLPTEVFAQVRDASGQAVLERYGMSETVMLTSNPYEGERRAGTVGLPLPGVELRLAEGTDEVCVRGPTVFGGYWRRPDATRAAFDADGWFLTGDVGSLDADGYLRLVGRRKELIISGGYNVYPREVEDVLREHPAVADVAVAGEADPEWGERVVAYVVGDERAADAVAAHAAARLAPYKRPKRLVFVADLPRNALGKVLRHQLG